MDNHTEPPTTNTTFAVGCMSGTSLDGLDVALCRFEKRQQNYNFKILAAQTIDYQTEWKDKLRDAHLLNARSFIALHRQYGNYIGRKVQQFLAQLPSYPIEFVASHGHTIFHEPAKNISFQLADPAAIAAACQLPVIADFRTLDINLGGQGAPLVPIGDQLLFGQYHYCLNLGGYANISFQHNNKRIAFDIVPANKALNYFALREGAQYDDAGQLGKQGTVVLQLLQKLNAIDFYSEKPPKSLANEWLERHFMPLCQNTNFSNTDILATLYEHIATQIARVLKNAHPAQKMLVTGGGAHNSWLIQLIKQKTNLQIIVPEKIIVDYKEALIFAFLGVLYNNNQVNTLQSVTGATRNTIGGVLVKW